MSLQLGKNFDRSYSTRISLMDINYNISTFFNTKSGFMLFRVDPDSKRNQQQSGTQIQMFKNLESSKFCERFIKLHNYRKSSLDIRNQFEDVKNEMAHEINYVLNETINLSKVVVGEKTFCDTLTLYGLTLSNYSDEFFYLIAERQNIVRQLNKKVVRTIGIQFATPTTIEYIKEMQSDDMFKTHPTKNTFNSTNKPTIELK